ncbi:type II secretion system F family protein [Flavobacterium sp.]|uniref:type II secretion system F family protein n=1 Tax=Flavobacterium sp. TaxID=239 RepID=UPI00260C88B1|nr:type II secretion system F family protein [Flavobacterium sp.]
MAFKLENLPNKETQKESSFDIEKLLKKEITLFGKEFSAKQKFEFYSELGVLLKAGITIKDALHLIKENQKKESHKIIYQTVLQDVINGKPFSEAINQTKHFTQYEFYSIKIGEETGTLPKVCHSLGIFFERKNEQKRIVISALTYPVIVLSTAVLVVFFMLSYVVPMFEDIFRQNKIELPFLTKIIIAVSQSIKSYGWIFFLLIFLSIVLGKYLMKNFKIKSLLNNLILKTPIIGSFMSKIYLAQFTQAISLLTSSKVPILNSIQMVKNMIGFVPLQQSLERVEQSILKGKSLSDSLIGNAMFDQRIISLVKVAEETNQTEFVFNQLNEQYNNDVVRQSKLVATIIEPLIIIVVGLIVGVLLVALYLPMFELSSVIG